MPHWGMWVGGSLGDWGQVRRCQKKGGGKERSKQAGVDTGGQKND